MGILAVFFSLLGWACLGIGVTVLLEVLPALPMLETTPLPQWIFWFVMSALLFLASIAANMGGRRRRGGEEY
jgi:hypothetical protein